MAALTTVVALTRVRGARRHVDSRVDHCGRTIRLRSRRLELRHLLFTLGSKASSPFATGAGRPHRTSSAPPVLAVFCAHGQLTLLQPLVPSAPKSTATFMTSSASWPTIASPAHHRVRGRWRRTWSDVSCRSYGAQASDQNAAIRSRPKHAARLAITLRHQSADIEERASIGTSAQRPIWPAKSWEPKHSKLKYSAATYFDWLFIQPVGKPQTKLLPAAVHIKRH